MLFYENAKLRYQLEILAEKAEDPSSEKIFERA
jgi:hypothetical protein